MCELLVSNVDPYMKNQKLKAKFEQCGQVIDVDITDKGFAYVTFRSEAEAQGAIQKMDGATINGRQIKVKEPKPRLPESPFDQRQKEDDIVATHVEKLTGNNPSRVHLRSNFASDVRQVQMLDDTYRRELYQYGRDDENIPVEKRRLSFECHERRLIFRIINGAGFYDRLCSPRWTPSRENLDSIPTETLITNICKGPGI